MKRVYIIPSIETIQFETEGSTLQTLSTGGGTSSGAETNPGGGNKTGGDLSKRQDFGSALWSNMLDD